MVAVEAAAGVDGEAAVAVAGADSWYAVDAEDVMKRSEPVNGKSSPWWRTTLVTLLVAGV